jgi:hypothetical protein
MKAKRTERHYIVSDEGFAILPGENPIGFELLRAEVAEELVPDGPVEEDLVSTIAKCIWRKQRYQRFVMAKMTAAKFDPSHKAYDEGMALRTFQHALTVETAGHELERFLGRLGGHLADHLAAKCPKRNFATAELWVDAMKREVEEVLIPAAERFGTPPDEVLIAQSAEVLTDDLFARELEFEERIDAIMERAFDGLAKVKATKRQVTLREVRRFANSHSVRVVPLATSRGRNTAGSP